MIQLWAEKRLLCRRVNWYSVEEQLHSVDKILKEDFVRILPGHGRPGDFSNIEDQKQQISALLRAEGLEPSVV